LTIADLSSFLDTHLQLLHPVRTLGVLRRTLTAPDIGNTRIPREVKDILSTKPPFQSNNSLMNEVNKEQGCRLLFR